MNFERTQLAHNKFHFSVSKVPCASLSYSMHLTEVQKNMVYASPTNLWMIWEQELCLDYYQIVQLLEYSDAQWMIAEYMNYEVRGPDSKPVLLHLLAMWSLRQTEMISTSHSFGENSNKICPWQSA